ncbi:MAG: HD domain-containing protein [Candidatus Aminicenantes bacterium]
MQKKLMALMPEFELIKDEDLRKKCLLIWEKAVQKGGWEVDDLKEMPFTLLIKGTSINLVEHTRAVTLCSLRIAEVMLSQYPARISLNRDILLAGALLHDVGKLFEYKREDAGFVKSESGRLLRHPISGAVFASEFKVSDEVLHIIAAHSKEGDGARRTVEAVIVNHADFVNFESLKT